MTEAEWLACEDPRPMLDVKGAGSSERKLRLFAVACGWRVAAWMTDERSRMALTVGEQYADDLAGRRVLAKARRQAYEATRLPDLAPGREYYPVRSHAATIALFVASGPNKYEAKELARITAGTASALLWHLHKGTAERDEMAVQVQLLRDIIGNPFHPITLDPSWLTSTVVSLANQMYDTKDFSAMPILADALMDASCDNETILTHCRGPGPHVRGCFVIDLLTNRE